MNRTSRAGLYIHIPFCHSKCGYCDFYSITELDGIQAFIQSLNQEMEYYAGRNEFQVVYDSIYIGGGTPSILNLADIEYILASVMKYFTIHPQAEITLETNPGTLNSDKLTGLRSAGINRLSIGVQSFLDHELKLLGRIHTARQAEEILSQALETGFSEISLDLIFALPGQTAEDWQFNLDKTLSYQPHHISTYNLIIEEGTPFHSLRQNGRLKTADADQEAELYIFTETHLKEAGYVHYEISNYARSENNISRHNFKYWQHTPYLSFGPSAHSFWQNRRWKNVPSVTDYIQMTQSGKAPMNFMEELTDNQILHEHILLALRTSHGIHLPEFENTFRFNFLLAYQQPVQNLIRQAYAEVDKEYFKLTSRGMLVCDEILPHFIQ